MFLLCPFPGEELRPTDSHVLTQQEGLVEFGSCDSRGRVQTTSTAARIFRAGAPGGVGGGGGAMGVPLTSQAECRNGLPSQVHLLGRGVCVCVGG